MSRDDLNDAVERVLVDRAFRALLVGDPDRALADHELTADERAALLVGDPRRLEELGVDERLTRRTGRPLYDGP
jgi:hypothetical protein